jgi:hypothetical protein
LQQAQEQHGADHPITLALLKVTKKTQKTDKQRRDRDAYHGEQAGAQLTGSIAHVLSADFGTNRAWVCSFVERNQHLVVLSHVDIQRSKSQYAYSNRPQLYGYLGERQVFAPMVAGWLIALACCVY